jgi:hypothetical protein
VISLFVGDSGGFVPLGLELIRNIYLIRLGFKQTLSRHGHTVCKVPFCAVFFYLAISAPPGYVSRRYYALAKEASLESTKLVDHFLVVAKEAILFTVQIFLYKCLVWT